MNTSILSNLRAGTRERQQTFLAAVRDFARPMLNDDGSWAIDLTTESGRLDLQLASAFYRGGEGDIALANQLTQRAPIQAVDGKRFGIFRTSIACHHLAVFGDRMTPETRSWCEQVLEDGCYLYQGMSSPHLQFLGWNDNMPAMAVKTLILGGEMLEHPEWVAIGTHNLRGLAQQLSRWGLISEYNSPNYTPDTIHNLTTLAMHTRDAELRRLATDIVRRVWLDLAAHRHPSGRCQAGPFSRAYAHDFNNYVSSLNCVIWFLLGPDASPVSAMEAIEPRPGIEPMHGNDPLEHAARMAWYALLDDALLDDETANLFLCKPDPYACTASTYQGDWTGAWGSSPLRKTTATTYMTHDWSLGSVSFAFCGGEQTASVYATGRREGISPVMYSRYLINDVVPGCDRPNDWHRLTTGEAQITSRATAVTVQHEGTALASYVPHRDLAEEDISRLCLALIAPRSVGQFNGFVATDGEPMEVDRSYPADRWYGAALGDAIIAFRAFACSAVELPAPVLIPRRNARYDFLEVVNYDGPPRRFEQSELGSTLNGLVVEIASLSAWKTPQAFIQALDEVSVGQDHLLIRTRNLLYSRTALPDRKDLMLGLRYSTEYDGCAERVVNGRLAPEPVWDCTDPPASPLPFIDSDPVMPSPTLPWPKLDVHAFPDIPWVMNPSVGKARAQERH